MTSLTPVALITGASSGIGEALAVELNARGYALMLLARRADRLQALSARLKATAPVIWKACDVTQPVELQAAVSETLQKFGQINLVFANAGFGVSGPFNSLAAEDYQRQFDVNVFGVIHTLKATFEALKSSKGSVCILGSVMSYVSAPGSTPYVMSKFAVRGLSEGLVHEWREEGISVTLACPGMVESEIRRVDNFGQLHEAPDPVPKAFIMPATKCAQKIIRATLNRRREVIITLHGRLGIWISRFFPDLFHGALRIFKIRGGRQKSSAVQNANRTL